MDWKKRFKADERDLKVLVDKLSESQEDSPLVRGERERALRDLGMKLAEMRAFIDDCMSGRSDHEKSVLEYKLRVEYPLFAHLTSLSTISREYVEWSHVREPEFAASAH